MKSNLPTPLLFFLLVLAACNDIPIHTPYQIGRAFVFEVSVIDSAQVSIIDTLTLRIKNKGLLGRLLGMNFSTWTSLLYPNNKQERGVNIESDFVEIQMPLGYPYLEYENIVIAGYPSFSKMMKSESTSESEHYFPKSYGKLAGEKLMQHSRVVDSAFAYYKNKKLLCKVREGQNTSGLIQFGIYRLQTFYHPEYGFVQMNFTYPGKKKIIFQLVEIEEN